MTLNSQEFLALLKTVVADPTDEAPRGALADWLTDNGYDQLAAVVAALPAIWPVVRPLVREAVYDAQFNRPTFVNTVTDMNTAIAAGVLFSDEVVRGLLGLPENLGADEDGQ